MKKKTILSLISIIYATSLFAQVGIKVENPLADFHVNGDIQITKEIRVGGGKTTAGDPGTKGQLLKSNGEGVAPEWIYINIPIVPTGNFSMTNSTVLVDKTGLEIENGTLYKRQYDENESISAIPPVNDPNAIWHIFPELTNYIDIVKESNKINFTMQTMTHLSDRVNETNKIPLFTYAIGIFIDGKLKSVKSFKISGDPNSSSPFEVVTLIATAENVPIGNHKIEIAVIPRLKGEGYLGNLAIGRPNRESTNLSSFMARTSLKIDVFEILN